MKNIFFILLVLTFCANELQAQNLTNYFVHNAEALCSPYYGYGGGGEGTFDVTNGFVCNGSQAKFYYVFEPTSDYVLSSTNPNGIGFRGYTDLAGTVLMSVSYKLYGPFNPNQGYASLIESNTVQPIATGAATTAPHYLNLAVSANKHYVLEITGTDADCKGKIAFTFKGFNLKCPDSRGCESCIPKFQPMGGKYVVTGWVKEQGGESKTAYTHCKMTVISGSGGTATSTDIPVSGQIIDGWQRMERDDIPGSLTGEFAIELTSTSGECYFDDIRVIPYDGSMVSYVYDPVTMRLIAELDERNYAKIYEYDEEGKLIRVKKETEKGTFTITETKENSSAKQEPGDQY